MPDEVKRRAALADFDDTAAKFPGTTSFLVNQENARIAHDDLGNLTAVEKGIRALASTGRYISGGAPNSLAGDVGAGFQRASRGAAGIFQAVAEFPAPLLDVLEPTTPEEWAGWRRYTGGNPLRRLAEGFAESGAEAEANARRLSPPIKDDNFAAGVSSGVQSFTQNLIALPMAFMPGGQQAALAMMTGGAGGQAYQEAREQGLSAVQALPYAVSQGTIEYATERLPLLRLVGDVKAGTPLMQTLVRQLAAEVPGEQVATILQDMNAWAVLPENKDKPFSEYLAERPSAAAQTLVATLIGTGGNIAVTKTIDAVVTSAETKQRRASEAAQAGEQVDQLSKAVAASKVKQRDGESFRQFVEQIAEDGDVPTELYINAETMAKTLQQSGISRAELEAIAPVVASQLSEVASDGVIRVPVSEFAMADQQIVAPLIDHLRTDPNGMSRAEANEFLAQEGGAMQQEFDAALSQEEEAQAFQSSVADVQSTIEAELNSLGRFQPEVNKPYAALIANFYGAQASRLGITPKEMFDRYRVGVAAKDMGGTTLAQDSGLAAISEQDEIFSLPRSEGTTLEQVVADNNPGISVRKTDLPGMETMWTLRMPDGRDAIITSRKPGAKGGSVYSNDFDASTNSYDQNTSRPGENAESIDPSVEDVWIDVSRLKEGGAGSMIYNIAATFAHNTGRIFIGDPSGISATAMRRRPENMLSSALKFGTTRHLAPHPDQVRGKDGVPPLKWVYGDDAGNVRKLIDLTLQIQENAGNESLLQFDESDGFRAADGRSLRLDERTGRLADQEGGGIDGPAVPPSERAGQGRPGNAGDRTLARNAVFRSLLREESGEGDGAGRDGSSVLARLVGLAGESSSPLKGLFYQDAVRGSYNPETKLIALLQSADYSTFVHESGHFFLDVQADLAMQIQQQISSGASVTPAEAGIVEDMNKLLDWFGIQGQEGLTPLEVWSTLTLEEQRESHEKFARGFEAYAREGKAPSIGLQATFQKFRSWLVTVYKTLAGLNVKLTDDVRAVMGRMLATDSAIAEAQAQADMGPLFRTAEDAGMTAEEYEAYQSTAAQATGQAAAELDARLIGDLKWLSGAKDKFIKARQAEAAELRKEVMREVRPQVMSQPVYRAWTFLTGRQNKVGTGDLSAADDATTLSGKLRTSAAEGISPELAARMKELRMTQEKDGLSPDIVAETFGFPSGEYMMTEIAKSPTPSAAVSARVDQVMLERYGDINSPESLARAADEAVHNELRAKVIATELKALASANKKRESVNGLYSGSTVDAMARAAKTYAEQSIARQRIKDIRPKKYAAAEARSAKLAEKNLGNLPEAAKHKRNQLINNYATKAAYQAQEDVQKGLDFFRKVNAGNAEKISATRDVGMVQAARAILAEYGLGAKGEPASKYLDSMSIGDKDLHAVLKERVAQLVQGARPYQELSVEEFRGLRDEIKGLWFQAKRSMEMEIDGKMIPIERAKLELVGRMEELGIPDRVPGEGQAVTNAERLRVKLQTAGAILRRVEAWAGAKDGSQAIGPFRKYVWQPVKEAADRYRADKAKYLKKYRALLEQLEVGESRIEAPELGYSFGASRGGSGKAEILHAILHTGNDSNKRKLLLGRGWAEQNADGSLNTQRWDAFVQRMVDRGVLTKKDFDFAQGVWDLLEETKPLAQKTHRAVFGYYFEEVTANSFNTPFGEYRGGYVPAMMDPEVVKDAQTRALQESESQTMAYAFPSTSKGFTKSRVENNKPLLLDLRSLSQHIDKVLLFSHMEAPIRDVRKVLASNDVSTPLHRIDPTAFDSLLTPWLNRAARQTVETPTPGDNGLMRFFSKARANAGMAAMFANLSNTAQQITGFSLAALKVKPRYLVGAMAQWAKAPRQTARAVAESSVYMAGRMDNEVAQMTDAIDQILLNPSLFEKSQAWMAKHAYFMQAAVDNVMGPIIWNGAYNQALESGMSDADAIRLADSAVRETQGSTLPEDVSRAETGVPLVRLFTQFAGYFNMQANLLGTEFGTTMREMGLRKGMGKGLYLFTFGFMVPAMLADAIALAFRGGPGDEDGDGEYLDDWLMSMLVMAPIKNLTAMIPGLGQFAVAGINRWNDKPYDDRVSLSPAISMLEASVGSTRSVYEAVVNDGNPQRAVRDVATLISMTTGLPATALARPIGYASGVMSGNVDPESPLDAARGLVTGVASPESRN
jgi:hypothetical protein